MQHLDEGTIHAWLDGELPLAEGEAVAAHVAQCEQCAAAVAEARGFIAASSRILTALDAVPGGVLPAGDRSRVVGARAPVRFRISRAWMAAAAVLVLSTVAVIVIRPRRDLALRVAEARKEEATLAAPEVARSADTAVPTAEEPAPVASNQLYSKKPPTVIPSAPGRAAAPAEDRPTLAGKIADKSSERELAERKDARAKLVETTALSLARAAPRRDVTDAASGVPGAGATMPDDTLVAKTPAPTVAQAPAPASQTDSLSRKSSAVVLQQLVITGEGTTSAVEKLGANAVSDTTTPAVVSRETTSDRGDTLVTTVYEDHGVRLILSERSPARPEIRRMRNAGAQIPFGRSGSTAVPINSIGWSDSTGRSFTLRGAASLAELERIKSLLLGPTP